MENKQLSGFFAKFMASVEHPFATLKRIVRCKMVSVTELGRAKVRLTFICTYYNLFRAFELASVKRW